ncbi:RNA polymerase Rpb4-domain-containing protein [Vararia minispora EC-137]|uniref:RNA polymerase Rpb4-domain-containing protein n=1 Tax=Vararia minispora EC-137 TaxID=1314806 RepID=A0ACB8Q5C7_9AGAM|nr:RNA polymerase Rpb4-domain-containing protein [Vararia minispora EC-137]
MEVLNPRESLLSNFEVLALLNELEADYHSKTKTAQRIKKEDEAAGVTAPRAYNPLDDISQNLRTIEVEAIQYLNADFQPTRRQTPQGITRLVKALEPYGLTKAEKLQVVNLAPTATVELYILVEDPEERIDGVMDEILDHVRASLTDEPLEEVQELPAPAPAPASIQEAYAEEDAEGENWEEYAQEDDFVDHGEGAGIEGDLDVEED